MSFLAGDPDDVDMFQAWRGTSTNRYAIHTREGARLGTSPSRLRELYRRELMWVTHRGSVGEWVGGYALFGHGGVLYFTMVSEPTGAPEPKPADAEKVLSIQAYAGTRSTIKDVPFWLAVC